jgi:hypothetical protein
MRTITAVVIAAVATGCATQYDTAKLVALSAAATEACRPIGVTLPAPGGGDYSINFPNAECGKALGAIAGSQTTGDLVAAGALGVMAATMPILGQVYMHRATERRLGAATAAQEETQRSMWSTFRDAALQGNSYTHEYSYSYSDSSDHSAHHHSTAPPPPVVQLIPQIVRPEIVRPDIYVIGD